MQAELETINISQGEAQQASHTLKSKPYVLLDHEGYVKQAKLHVHQNCLQSKCTKVTEYKLKINTILKLSHKINNI